MFGISTLRKYQLCHIFDISWLLKTYQADVTWLASRLLPPYLSAFTRTALSSVKLCFPSSQHDCFRAVWNATPLQPFDVSGASKRSYILWQMVHLNYFNTRTVHFYYFVKQPTKAQLQLIYKLSRFPRVSTLSCHLQGARIHYLAKLHKYINCSCW